MDFLGWFESWRLGKRLPAALGVARRFWKEVVQGKPREEWQLEQWAEAMRWFLRWLELARKSGADHRSLAERVRDAVELAGARRGLARPTRQAYGSWAARFASTVKTPREAMEEDRMSVWLGKLVSETKIAFSTQKQALNALVFFLKDVCGRDEVCLKVKMRKRSPRIPIVPHREEILEAGCDLRTIQKLLGHADVKTTEIYTHVAMGVGGTGVVSPLDRLGGNSSPPWARTH